MLIKTKKKPNYSNNICLKKKKKIIFIVSIFYFENILINPNEISIFV